MNKKIQARSRRAGKTRALLNRLKAPRITVCRSNKQISAQLIVVGENNQHSVLAAASSLEASVSSDANKVEQAQAVGKLIAQRAKEQGITKIGFDRSGFKYHGRIKALADAAREEGLEF